VSVTVCATRRIVTGRAGRGIVRGSHHRNRSGRTIANRQFQVGQAVRLLRALGANKVCRINKPPFVIHSHSTMRMGVSEEDSVLDAT